MSIQQHDSGPTSNDLLESLIAGHTPAAPNYRIVAQSAEDVENLENAPAVRDTAMPDVVHFSRVTIYLPANTRNL